MSDYTQEQIDIVTNGIESGSKDDDILMLLFNSGVAFSALRTMFNGILSDNGLRLNSKDRKSKTAEIMEEYEITDETESTDVLAIIARLQTEMKCSTTQAGASLRTWAKDKGITLPKATKKPAVRKVGFTGIVRDLLDHVVANKEITRKGLEAYANENGIKKTYVTTVMNIVDFAKEFNSDVDSESEEAEAA